MVIRKGEAWGEPSGPSPDLTLVDDADLAAHVADHRGCVVSVAAGDLRRTLGLTEGARSDPLWFPMDLAFAALDGGPEAPFVAHAIARSRWWIGPAAAVMNAAWLGDRYLGPRSHPNDGLLDITFGALPVRQLPAAAKRSTTGAHLPHPALTVRRVRTWEHTFERPRRVWLDGQPAGSGRMLAVRVVPDWFTLVG